MPVPIEARCRHCRRDLLLIELIGRRDGKCPSCNWALSPDYTPMLLEESERAERALRGLIKALRRLVGLPGNLDLKPYSLLRSLFEEVGWEQDLVEEPDILTEEVHRLREQADRWAELISDEKESSSLAHTLRSWASRLRIMAKDNDSLGPDEVSNRKRAARHLEAVADAVRAGTAKPADLTETIDILDGLFDSVPAEVMNGGSGLSRNGG